MTCKDSFLMLTKDQKKSGRVYLTEGQLKFLKSKIGVESEKAAPIGVPDLSPPQDLTVLKVYDDSNDIFEFNMNMTFSVAYKIISYCKQNKITYNDLFKELLTHSPADKQVPDPSTTIREQIKRLSAHREKDIAMAKIGLISAREADIMLGHGRGCASRGVCKKELKCTRQGTLMYFAPSDLQKYAKTLKKKV